MLHYLYLYMNYEIKRKRIYYYYYYCYTTSTPTDGAQWKVSVKLSVSHRHSRAITLSAHCTETQRVPVRDAQCKHQSSELYQSMTNYIFIVQIKFCLNRRWHHVFNYCRYYCILMDAVVLTLVVLCFYLYCL